MRKLTKQEQIDLWSKVDAEGFGYYMLDYGPDLGLIERMGYNKQEVEKAIKLFSAIQYDIMSFEELVGEE